MLYQLFKYFTFQVPQAQREAATQEPHVTAPVIGDLWSINRQNISSEQLDALKDLATKSTGQIQKDFLEALCCLLQIERNISFNEHKLLINVTNNYVEFQEKFKYTIVAQPT